MPLSNRRDEKMPYLTNPSVAGMQGTSTKWHAPCNAPQARRTIVIDEHGWHPASDPLAAAHGGTGIMDSDTSGIVPEKGMTIVGSDGMRIGVIDLVEANYVIVRSGGLFPQDHFIAISDIVAQDADGALRLSMPADEALERTLGNPQGAASADAFVPRRGIDTVPEEDAALDTGVGPVAREAGDVDTVAERDAERQDDDMHRTVPVVEETLDVHVRPVDRGTVHVGKKIVEERQTFEVPLVEEEVAVTRRRVDREIRDDDHAFEEHSIEIPLHGQAVEIRKQAKVVEEIAIDKAARTRTERVTDTVRKESARVVGDAIENPGPADVDETDSDAR